MHTTKNFLFLGLIGLALSSGCPDSKENPCQIENHCVPQGAGGRCEAGYTWEDPQDPKNYNCVLLGGAPAADAGTEVGPPPSPTVDAGSGTVAPVSSDAGSTPVTIPDAGQMTPDASTDGGPLPAEVPDAGVMASPLDAGNVSNPTLDAGLGSPSVPPDAGATEVPQADAGSTTVTACADGAMQLGETACGINNDGAYVQLCSAGQWQDTTICSDSDVCVNGTTQMGPTVCGVQNGGTYRQECTNGQWADTDYCFDPDLVVTEVPNPSDIVEALPSEGIPTFYDQNSFLFNSDTPVQQGVNPEVFSEERMSVMKGYVYDEAGTALEGVKVEFPQNTEFGWTLTRTDGAYDIAINGGKDFLVRFSKEGYLDSSRRFTVDWRESRTNENVNLKALDVEVTTITLGNLSDAQVASGSLTSDERGTRQSRVIIPTGTTAQIIHSDGSVEDVGSLSIRSTEYTVGEDGPATMPGQLPPTSAYTYAMELSADEADAVDATSITFDPPIYHYVENFIGVPVGEPVPSGYYDKEKGYWVASENGLVIEILTVADGTVTLDADGDGIAEDAESESNLNITAEEKAQLASLYAPGETLWRVPIPHFTPWDCNYPAEYPSDAVTPGEGGAGADSNNNDPTKPDKEGPCECDGSIIQCETQSLRESIPIVGTPYELSYQSDRGVGANSRTVVTQLIGSSVPESLKTIKIRMEVAGVVEAASYTPSADLTHTWTWDGYDSFGRELKGVQDAIIEIEYVFEAVYTGTGGSTRDFGSFPSSDSSNWTVDRGEDSVGWVDTFNVQIGDIDYWRNDGVGLGGWSVTPHHIYDPGSGILHKGDGTYRPVVPLKWILRSAAGTGSSSSSSSTGSGLATETHMNAPGKIAILEDGSFYIATNASSPYRLKYVDADGYMSNIEPVDNAGDLCADNYRNVEGLAYDGNRNLYFTIDTSNWGLLCRFDLDTNKIHHVAGQLAASSNCETGSAENVALGKYLGDVEMGPDGSIYFSDYSSDCVRRVGLDGTVERIAGGGSSTPADGLDARNVRLDTPRGLHITDSGEIYIADNGNRAIYRVGPDGAFTVMATSGIGWPLDVTVSDSGTLYIVSGDDHVYSVSTEDEKEVIMGGTGVWAEFGSATNVNTQNLTDIVLRPDHTDGVPQILVAGAGSGSFFGHRVYLLGQFSTKFTNGEYVVPAKDGLHYYVFNKNGIHISTYHLLTEAKVYDFGYDEDGRLTTITDAYGLTTTFGHDGDGHLSQIQSHFGQTTTLTTNVDGMVGTLTTPGGRISSFTYVRETSLASYANANNETHLYEYDDVGRLVSDTLPNGGEIVLEREETETSYTVTKTSPEGLDTVFQYQATGESSGVKTVTYPNGDQYIYRYFDDGSRSFEKPSGTVVSIEQAPDPRFGMQLPYVSEQTTTYPSGEILSVEVDRELDIPDVTNLLYVATWTDITTVEDVRDFSRIQSMDNKTWVLESAGGRRLTKTFNDKGRLESVVHDSDITSSDDVNQTLNLTYDETNGFLTRMENAQNSFDYTHDAKGRVQTRTDAAGNVLTYGYDDDNNLISVLLNDEATSFQFEHDNEGVLSKVIMPSGPENDVTHGFDGQIESFTPPGASQGYAWSYGLDRRIETVTAISGKQIAYSWNQDRLSGYDSADEVASFTFGEVEVEGEKDTFSIVSKAGGSESASQSITQDGNRWVRSVGSGATEFDVSYTYNEFGEIVTESFSSGDDIYTKTREYDSDGLIITENGLTQDRKGPFGRPLSLVNADESFTQVYVYDEDGHLTGKALELNGATVYDMDVSYNIAGFVGTKNETLDSETESRAYTYSDRGALLGVDLNSADEEDFSYDSHGNRVVANTENASYDNQDRVTSVGDWTYAFDVDGAMTSRTDGATTESFVYSMRGTLLSANSGSYSVDYSHDAFGRLIKRASATNTLEYFYLNPTKGYQLTAYRSDAEDLVELIYDGNNHLISLIQGGNIYYVATDHLGTPRAVFDDAGTLVKEITYTAFGEIVSDTNANFVLPVGFAGGLSDVDTGLVRFGFRDYDPRSGRWTMRDPLLYASNEVNLYRYVGNNPITFKDPLGLWTFSIGVSLSGFLGPISGNFGGGIVFGQDDNGDWQLGFYATEGVGVGTGGDVDASFDFGFSTNDCICDVGGQSVNWGGGGGALGHGSFDVGHSVDGADPVITGSIGVGVGGGGGVSYNDTSVYRLF